MCEGLGTGAGAGLDGRLESSCCGLLPSGMMGEERGGAVGVSAADKLSFGSIKASIDWLDCWLGVSDWTDY